MMVLSVILMAIANACLPYTSSVAVLAAITLCTGQLMGIVPTNIAVLLAILHTDNFGAYLQTGSAVFALGATGAPFMFALLVSKVEAQDALTVTMTFISLASIPPIIMLLYIPSPRRPLDRQVSGRTDGTNEAGGLWELRNLQGNTRTVFFSVIFLATLLFSIPNSLVSFVASYGVEELNMGESKASYFPTVYWGASCVARILGIYMAMICSASTQMGRDAVLVLLGGTILLGWVANEHMAWIGVAIYGYACGAAYAQMYAFLHKSTQVTNSMSAAIMASIWAGDMTLPLLAGFLIEQNGIQSLFAITWVGSLLLAGAMANIKVQSLWLGVEADEPVSL